MMLCVVYPSPTQMGVRCVWLFGGFSYSQRIQHVLLAQSTENARTKKKQNENVSMEGKSMWAFLRKTTNLFVLQGRDLV